MKLVRPPSARRPLLARLSFSRAVAAAVAAVALALAAAPARAQTGPELLLKPFPKELRLDANADASITEQGHAEGSDLPLQLGIVEAEGRIRLTPGELASPRVGFGLKFFNIDSSVPGLPDHLWDVTVGAAFPIGRYEDWIFAASVGVGYAGSGPFGDGNGWYGRATIAAIKQIDETSALSILIDYDGNRTFKPDVPLPGIAYFKRIDKRLALTVGLPVTGVEWEPIDNLRLSLNYVLVDNIEARVGYTVGGGFELFGALGQRSDAFFVDGRDSSDRLLFQQRRVEAGVTYRSKDGGVDGQNLEFTVAGGYAFNGEFSAGFDQLNSDLVADVSDEPYVRLSLAARF